MLLSLAIIFLGGLAAAAVCEKAGLPRIVGMLALGAALGPYALDVLDPSLLSISPELRRVALIIILIKAGLSLDLSDLKKAGRPAAAMAFLPASFEIAGYLLFAPLLLGISLAEAAVMGAVLSAVSPAVVVPRMTKLIDEKYGTKKLIPQTILAGASCDDVYVIALFSAFATIAKGGSAKVSDFAAVPVSIVLGAALGAAAGLAARFLLGRSGGASAPVKIVVLLGTAFLLDSAETLAKPYAAVSGLVAVVAAACAYRRKADKEEASRLAKKFGEIWIPAEILLFVLVGAAVDARYAAAASGAALATIALALLFRTAGVFLSVAGTGLNAKERLFCAIAYLPKATVQAAIGSVPLAMGLPCGKLVLSVAALAIIVTAPLGAIGIDRSYKKLLEKNE